MSADRQAAATRNSDFLTVDEAARELKASPRSVYRAVRSGALKAAPINQRGDLRIARQWLMDFVERAASLVRHEREV